MINTAKLKGKIVENGYTQDVVADAVSICRSGFNQKLNNKSKHPFTVDQVWAIREFLNIKDPAESDEIFFAQVVSKRKQAKEAAN